MLTHWNRTGRDKAESNYFINGTGHDIIVILYRLAPFNGRESIPSRKGGGGGGRGNVGMANMAKLFLRNSVMSYAVVDQATQTRS